MKEKTYYLYFLAEINPCDNDPCGTTGVCIQTSNLKYRCDCYPGYTGNNCEQGK